jgi:glyoxylase-like metal-dependent hydrolase (beta-lactamase superfamily II)/ferredoxin
MEQYKSDHYPRTLVFLQVAPKKLPDNAQGPLYVNDRCINCSACSMFAPSVFSRNSKQDTHHLVSKQPTTELEIDEARAAMVACPVAAIRVENILDSEKDSISLASQFAIKPGLNGRSHPFPRPVSPNVPDVHFVGHHNERSFGAAPYLLAMPSSSTESDPTWILVDTPKYSKKAVDVVESLTGPGGPSHLVLTHVDDTADHNRWKEQFPNMKRIFHSGDLGKHNWIGDETLGDVEVLLESSSSVNHLQHFDLEGTPIDSENVEPIVIVHTPGHSPGSISLLKKPTDEGTPGVLFTGDTYAYTTRGGGHGSGFPRYNKDSHKLQSNILRQLLDLDWKVLAPGHAHARDYTLFTGESVSDLRKAEIEEGIAELLQHV